MFFQDKYQILWDGTESARLLERYVLLLRSRRCLEPLSTITHRRCRHRVTLKEFSAIPCVEWFLLTERIPSVLAFELHCRYDEEMCALVDCNKLEVPRIPVFVEQLEGETEIPGFSAHFFMVTEYVAALVCFTFGSEE